MRFTTVGNYSLINDTLKYLNLTASTTTEGMKNKKKTCFFKKKNVLRERKQGCPWRQLFWRALNPKPERSENMNIDKSKIAILTAPPLRYHE